MNITESVLIQNVTAFLAGNVDHCDETTRAAIAGDLHQLQVRSHKALGAGAVLTVQQWDEHLCRISFEGE